MKDENNPSLTLNFVQVEDVVAAEWAAEVGEEMVMVVVAMVAMVVAMVNFTYL